MSDEAVELAWAQHLQRAQAAEASLPAGVLQVASLAVVRVRVGVRVSNPNPDPNPHHNPTYRNPNPNGVLEVGSLDEAQRIARELHLLRAAVERQLAQVRVRVRVRGWG